MLSNKIIYDYYSYITCYKYDGSLCNFEEIELMILGDLEEPHVSFQHSVESDVGIIRHSRTVVHTTKIGSKYSNPILINDFCFFVVEIIFGSKNFYFNNYDYRYSDFRLALYSGYYNDIYYKKGINSDNH